MQETILLTDGYNYKVVISNSYKDWDKIITSDKLIVEKVW